MRIHFEVSAPGKVILHGEHSVVYSKPAIAGVIGLRNKLILEENNDKTFSINLDLLENIQLNLKTINNFIQKSFLLFDKKKLPQDINHEVFHNDVKEFLIENNLNKNEQLNSSLSSVFYLLIGILIDQGLKEIQTGINIKIITQIYLGAGLGSSASYGCILAAGFYFYSQFKNGNKNIELNDNIRQYISDWSFCSEKIMHGNPSGLDNTISTFGNIVKFYKGVKPINVKLVTPLNILLVNTRVSRSTMKLVEKVAALKMEHTKLIEIIFDAMGQLVEDAVEILENLTGDDDVINYKKLETLVRINNNLLRSIGVSHSSLEKIFSIAETHGFSAKLTGAGGGGYATILLPPKYNDMKEYNDLCEDLSINKIEYCATCIGGNGLMFNLL